MYRAEHFFEIHKLTEEEKIKVAIISFDHNSVDWYRWSHNQSPIESWAELERRMFVRFRSSREGSLTRRFLAIKQEGTYAEYRKMFERFSAPIPEMSESILEGTFINGLDPKLKAKVESRNPVGLEATMREAQAIDDEMSALREIDNGEAQMAAKGEGKSGGSDKAGQGNNYRPNTTKIQLPERNRAPQRDWGTRRLTDAEICEKRECGLCFKCEEKYSPKHRGKAREKRELQLLIAGEGQVDIEVDRAVGEDELEEPEEKVELALRSVLGFSTPGTMKLKGRIGEREVVVLIDCGATHNFIHRQLVDKLNIPVTNTTHYGIVIGNRSAIQGKGVCKEVIIELLGVTVMENFLPIDLGRIDVILGMSWLHTIGYMGVD